MKTRIIVALCLATLVNAQTSKTPINNGILQSDLNAAGYKILSANLADYAGANMSWNAVTGKFDATGGGGGATARKFDVKTYGAVGNGTTDDTTAIQAALAAIPPTGGVMYFPAGQYKYAGPTLTLSNPVTVEGDGGGVEAQSLTDSPALAITTIDYASATVPLFTVTANGCTFKNLELRNTSGTTPSAGAGIVVTSNGDRTNYENISVNGFYIGIDVQSGWMQTWDNCYIIAPVLYGLKLRNIAHPDYGDHSISNCQFLTAKSRAATSAIRIESGGGVKIVNSKINMMAFMAFPWVNGIDLALANNVQTSDLLVSNCSIESFSAVGIKGTTGATTSQWGNIVITGNQFFPAIANNQYAINFSATTAGDFNGVSITGNFANISSSGSPMILLANCTNVALTGNAQYGFSDVLSVGSGVTFARSATIPVGGATGQALVKNSGANYDAAWGNPRFNAVTVATLPGSPTIGQVASVSDGTASLAWGATVTGGGSTKYLVWWNGTNWTVAGK